jgi:crotonobetainyl-CoA:carnitine CoA-transferase CaiB-like acyl-CoA transferase
MEQPLAGIKIVDLTMYIAGSYAAMLLGDLGAEVVKIEAPTGDPFRQSPGFLGWNRSKRSLCLDLKATAGREIVDQLVQQADVVMENYRPGVADKLGVGYDRVRALNPRVIYCSVSAFGQEGPWREKPGFDPMLQALGGVMAIQGGEGAPPEYVRVAVSDYYAAALAAYGVMTALFVRERTGIAQRVETSLLNAVIAIQSGQFLSFAGKPSFPRENPVYRLYKTADGYIFIACGNDRFWQKLCQVIQQPELAEDPRFATRALRNQHHQELIDLLRTIFLAKSSAEWLQLLEAGDVPSAPVQTLEEFMLHPQVQAAEIVVEQEHPVVGKLRMMGLPVKLEKTPGATQRPAPVLGEHTDEVLRELGYSPARIHELKAQNIVMQYSGQSTP